MPTSTSKRKIVLSDVSGDEQLARRKGAIVQPPKKRTKKRRAAVPIESSQATSGMRRIQSRKHQAVLSCLPDMPLDILHDIFGYLPPNDLVHLTWLNKAFYQVLTSKSFQGLWKASFEYVPELPPRPDGMSYRGWAHVLCEECYYCVEKTTFRILFEFRKHVCRACSKTKLVHWDYLKVPEPFSRRVRKLFTVEDVVPTIRISGVLMCEKAAADEFVKELLGKIKKIGPHDAARLRSATGDLVQARESVLSHRREHIEMCNKWQDKLIEERDRPVINERKECIMWNILALGYTMKDWHDSRLSTHMLVNVGQPLTDKSWSKIRPVLEKKILAIRELYLKRKKSVQGHLLRLYAQAISPAEFPFIPDGETCLKTISLFDRILSNWKYGSSDAAWWTEAQEELLQFVQYMASVGQHNRRCLAKALLRSAPNEVSASNDDLVTLGLALSMFQIRQSDGSLSPTIHFGTEVQCHIAPVSYNVDPKVQRHLKHVVISIRAQATVRSILATLGLPQTTTARELDRMPTARFACHSCPPEETLHGRDYVYKMPALTWRAMVDHACKYHPNTVSFRALNEVQLVDVYQQERNTAISRGQLAFACCHCPLRDATRGPEWMFECDVKDHLKELHRIVEPVEDVDFFFNSRVRKADRPCVSFEVQAV